MPQAAPGIVSKPAIWSLKGKAFWGWGVGGEGGEEQMQTLNMREQKQMCMFLQIQVSDLCTQEVLHNLMEGPSPWEKCCVDSQTCFWLMLSFQVKMSLFQAVSLLDSPPPPPRICNTYV